MTLHRQFVVGMHLYGEVLAGVDELNEQREGVTKLLIDTFANEQTFVLVDEFREVQPEIHIANESALDGNGLMARDARYLPRLAYIRLSRVDTFERGYLVSAPDHGAEIGSKFVGLHAIDNLTIYNSRPVRSKRRLPRRITICPLMMSFCAFNSLLVVSKAVACFSTLRHLSSSLLSDL